MTESTRSPRLAWLVNLFGDPDAQHAHAAATLRPLAARLGAEVVPVYALDPGAEPLDALPEVEQIPYTAARLRALMGEHDLPAGEPVIAHPGAGASLRERVDALADAMRAVDPLLIAVHTHAYTALDRFFLGSFSEKFFTRSPAPVLVLNPHAPAVADIARVLFATDLSTNAEAAFGALLPMARALGATVHVEHVLPVRELPLFMSSSASRAQYDAEIAAQRSQCESALAAYRVLAERTGVPCHVRVDEERASLPIGESLEALATSIDAGLVAVAAHGDHQRLGNLGSVALWLMRRATRPILVFPARTR
jgi:nucleotide-binding universal stress UspA family protein